MQGTDSLLTFTPQKGVHSIDEANLVLILDVIVVRVEAL